MSREGAVFVVGLARSGSTLLSRILGGHSRIFYGGECHFFEDVYSRRRELGDLRLPDARAKAVERLLTLYGRTGFAEAQHKCDRIFAEPERRSRLDRSSSYAELLAAFLGEQADAAGKRRWCCHMPKDVFRLDQIAALFPDARFVVTVRDPRGYLASYRCKWKRGGSAENQARLRAIYHPVVTSLLWAATVGRLGREDWKAGSSGPLAVRYEDLVREPETAARRVMDFVGEVFEPAQLDVEGGNSSFSHKPGGIFRDSVDRWRRELPRAEQGIAQVVCRRGMAELGYQTEPVAGSSFRMLGWLASTPVGLMRGLYANRTRRGSLGSYIGRRMLGLLRGALVLAAAIVATGCGSDASPPLARCDDCSLILISIDTLRADHLGAYGYELPTSPNLDAFARRAVLFETARSLSHRTADSHMALFTSLYPSVHGVQNARFDEPSKQPSQEIETLAQSLERQGFETVAFHGGGNVSERFGFDRGFGRYENARGESFDAAIHWLESRPGGRFFLFVHTYHVHDPYMPGPPFDAMFRTQEPGSVLFGAELEIEAANVEGRSQYERLKNAQWNSVDRESEADVADLRALYDGEIREIDRDVGRLLEAVDRLVPRAVVALTADHGEEFGEHGRFRHNQLYEELLHVPLILRAPVLPEGARVSEPVSHIDLGPTLLDLLGSAPLRQAQGGSLLPFLAGQGPPPAFTLSQGRALDRYGFERAIALVRDELKLILPNRRGVELYDLSVDPGETRDLGADDPRALAMLDAAHRLQNANLRLAKGFAADRAEVELDEAALDELRALGYLN